MIKIKKLKNYHTVSEPGRLHVVEWGAVNSLPVAIGCADCSLWLDYGEAAESAWVVYSNWPAEPHTDYICDKCQAAHENFYLEYLNDYLTIAKMAEHKAMTVKSAKRSIAIGRAYHWRKSKNV